MGGVRPSNEIVRFAEFELDFRAGELRKHGAKLKLQEQPFQILQILLQCPGKIVTQLAVGQRQITCVLAIAESAHFLFMVRACVLVPQNIECIEHRLRTAEQQVFELWLAMRIKAHDLAIEYATAALQVTR
jgi:hypothetical protein